MNTKVCAIGAGDMGSALASALIVGGHPVVVWNRTRSKCEPLEARGASVAQSVEDAVRQSDVVIMCVSNNAVAIESFRTAHIATVLKGKVVVQLTTVSTDESVALSEWVQSNGATYLDGSILGRPQGIENNDCTILYSGPRNVFESIESVLKSMGGRPRLIGEKAGIVPAFDKALYSRYYLRTLGLFQGAAICEAIGAPLDLFFENITLSPIEENLAKQIMQRDYTPIGATLNTAMAAHRSVLEVCKGLDVDADLHLCIADIMKRGVDAGYGEQDSSVLFKVLMNE
jgi:3-hydroxyisobutyrate dehydrogenase-like beta-hydroxyacid dehydrogenase